MKTANYSDFKIAVASDLHLGNTRVSAEFMIENLRRSFKRDAAFAALDVLAFAGDVMDHMLQWPHEDTSIIEEWMIEILRQCAACNVDLWVLEGTPSHDRKQSKRFEILNERFKIGCRLSYVDQLCIKHFPRFDINVLFVPDEWSESAEKTLAEVYEHMKAAGIEKIDYAIMHGQFDYQLPEFVPGQKHNSDTYLKIVDKLIFIGHVHIHRRKDRILPPGSHDRISHGEEGPKGFIRATVRSRDDYEIEFVENTTAAIFKTIELEDVSLADAVVACRRIASEMPDGANLRIRSSPDSWSLSQLTNEMEAEFPLINWSCIDKKSKEKIKKLSQELSGRPKLPDLITIEPGNVERLVVERIWENKGADSNSVADALKLLKELK